MAAGQRSAAIEHDDLDRVTAVSLDGRPLLEYAYDPLAAGAIAGADRITAEVAVAPGTSTVFGTLDTIVYTRPRPMDHAAVAYAPALKTFVPRAGHFAPDAVLRSSLARRSIPVGKAARKPVPFGYDKPSNSLFIPPQFAAANCRVCSGSIQSATFTASSGARAGQAVQFSALVTGTCTETGVGAYGSPAWQHSVSFGDGGATTASSFAGVASFSHVYTTAGTYLVRNRISCSCAALLNLIEKLLSIRVERAEPVSLPVPGDCTWDRYRELQDVVDFNCKGGRVRPCFLTDTCAQLVDKRGRFVECRNARLTINNICFRDGDLTHQQAAEEVKLGIRRSTPCELNCPAVQRLLQSPLRQAKVTGDGPNRSWLGRSGTAPDRPSVRCLCMAYQAGALHGCLGLPSWLEGGHGKASSADVAVRARR